MVAWAFGRGGNGQGAATIPRGVVPQPNLQGQHPGIQLVATLESMIALHQQFKSLLDDEKKRVIERDADGLLRLLTDKEAMLGQLRYFEERRKREITLLSREFGVASVTLQEVIARAPEPYRSRLMACQTNLQGLTIQVIEANRANAMLIQNVLGRVKNLVGFFKGMMASDTVYKPTGTLSEFRPYRRTIGKA